MENGESISKVEIKTDIEEVIIVIEHLLCSYKLTISEYKQILKELEERLDNEIGRNRVIVDKKMLSRCSKDPI